MVKKYANILMQRQDLASIHSALKACKECCKNDEFSKILKSSIISNDKKIIFIKEVLNAMNIEVTQAFLNLLDLLAESKNLEILTGISDAIDKQIEIDSGLNRGIIYSISKIDESELRLYEENLSSKFNKKIILENKLSEKNEVRVVLEDLGYEIVLSNQLIKNSIKEFIIKAI